MGTTSNPMHNDAFFVRDLFDNIIKPMANMCHFIVRLNKKLLPPDYNSKGNVQVFDQKDFVDQKEILGKRMDLCGNLLIYLEV
jgi:hypothetical protein